MSVLVGLIRHGAHDDLGTWLSGPVSARASATIAGSVTADASVLATTSPSASSVTVLIPSRTVAA